jgi:peptidoglycan hydrolase CwlO-like protein
MDLKKWIHAMEKQEQAHPVQFQQEEDAIKRLGEKLASIVGEFEAFEGGIAEQNADFQAFVAGRDSEESQRPFGDINERIKEANGDVKKLLESSVKLNKELKAARAAINKRRAYFEDTDRFIDEVRRGIDARKAPTWTENWGKLSPSCRRI